MKNRILIKIENFRKDCSGVPNEGFPLFRYFLQRAANIYTCPIGGWDGESGETAGEMGKRREETEGERGDRGGEGR